MIELILPYPPSNNRYYRHGRGRNRRGELNERSTTYLSPEGEQYRMEVLARRPRTGWPLHGRLRVLIEVYPSRNRSQDLDNVPKSVLDALQHAWIYKDDNAIDELHVKRFPKVPKPYVRVLVATITEAK